MVVCVVVLFLRFCCLSERLLCLVCYWFYWTRLSNHGLVYTNTQHTHWRVILRGVLGGKLLYLVCCIVVLV